MSPPDRLDRMPQSAFHDLQFAAFVALAIGLPLAGCAVAWSARSLPRWVEPVFAAALVAAALANVILLRRLAIAVLATPSLADDMVFHGRGSLVLLLLPVAQAIQGVRLLMATFVDRERRSGTGEASKAATVPVAGDGEVRVVLNALLAMSIIFAVDCVTGSDVRLHVLYVFPLAAVAARCTQLRAVVAVLVLAIVLQIANVAADNASLPPFIVDTLVDIAASLLVAVLGRRGRRAFLQVEALARTDPLTGLANRRCFIDTLDAEILRQRRQAGAIAVAMIDLDGFKQLNDGSGHAAGDVALQAVADVLRTHLRQTDGVGRIGGDEFAIVLTDVRGAELAGKFERLRAAIEQAMQERSFAVTASIGAACFAVSPGDAARALARVDALMYAAKQLGRNRVVCECGPAPP